MPFYHGSTSQGSGKELEKRNELLGERNPAGSIAEFANRAFAFVAQELRRWPAWQRQIDSRRYTRKLMKIKVAKANKKDVEVYRMCSYGNEGIKPRY